VTGICGAVLAGGQSKRMTTDKALLPIGDSNLLQHQLQLLDALQLDAQLISGAQHQGIADDYPNRGPLAGLHALVQQCQQPYLLLLAVDMPLLQISDLTQLIDQGLHSGRPCHYQHHYLPLFLPNQPQMIHWLQQQLQQADASHCSMRRFCEQFDALAIDCQHPEHLSNANTPAEWQACLAHITR